MIAPGNWLEICAEEMERGALDSYPLMLDFARKRGMKDLEEVRAWKKQTRKNFTDMVTSALRERSNLQGEARPKWSEAE